MRLLLDTNVLIAAFIARGLCHDLLAHCIYNHEQISSKVLLREFQEKLVDKFRFTQVEARDAAALLAARLTLVEPVPLGGPVSRDPDDDVVLATALAGECRCIITGDRDLLVLKRFQEIPILSPSEFWRYETEPD